jgi:hypothetical protein
MRDQGIEKMLVGLLGKEVEERVERTVTEMNSRIRQRIRDSTGLKLTYENRTENIPVKIIPDLPEPFVRALRELDESLLTWLFKNSEDLVLTLRTLRNIADRYTTIENALRPDPPAASTHQILNAIELIEQLINWKKRFNWPSMLMPEGESSDELPPWTGREPFGSYYPREGVITIQWVAIGMFVALNDKFPYSVEDLTSVVLAHELVHAYTHRGFDTDGLQWETEHFFRCNIYIIEGLAQFYTKIVAKKLVASKPTIANAFEAMMPFMSNWYTDFVNWVPSHPHQSEIVRLAMIETRATNLSQYKAFQDALEYYADQWGGQL